MCGRFSSTSSTKDLISKFEIKTIRKGNSKNLKKKFNIGPNDWARIINFKNELEVAQWSILSNSKFSTFNARLETITRSPLWRNCKPCLVPSDGFYEFPDKSIRITLKSRDIFSYAGLYQNERFSIITTSPNNIIQDGIHDRMPAILKKSDEEAWLKFKDLSLLGPYPDSEMEVFEVSNFVNSTDNDGPECWNKPFQWL